MLRIVHGATFGGQTTHEPALVNATSITFNDSLNITRLWFSNLILLNIFDGGFNNSGTLKRSGPQNAAAAVVFLWYGRLLGLPRWRKQS